MDFIFVPARQRGSQEQLGGINHREDDEVSHAKVNMRLQRIKKPHFLKNSIKLGLAPKSAFSAFSAIVLEITFA